MDGHDDATLITAGESCLRTRGSGRQTRERSEGSTVPPARHSARPDLKIAARDPFNAPECCSLWRYTQVLTLRFSSLSDAVLGPARSFHIEGALLRQHPHDEVVS